MASLLIAVIYLCFISLGLPDSLLGSAWPVMQIEFGVPLSSMGIITMLISGCTIISGLFADRITRRIGTWGVTLISILLTVVGLFGFSFSPNFLCLCIFSLPYGLGAGAIDTVLNNYIALHYASRYMSWLHCFWGVGAIVSPYIMSFCLTRAFGWENGYRTVAFIQLGIAVIAAASLPLWRRRAAQDADEEKPLNLTFHEKFKVGGFPFILFAFFAYCAMEATCMTWASTYFVEAKNYSEEDAAAFASLFYIGMSVGRFLTGFITEKLGDRRLIRIGSAVALVGIITLALPLPPVVSLVAFVVIGLGCAPIYPAIVHSTPANFGRRNSQALMGLELSSAYIGFTFMPPLYGVIAGYFDAAFLPFYLMIFLAMHIVFMELLNRYVKRHPQESVK